MKKSSKALNYIKIICSFESNMFLNNHSFYDLRFFSNTCHVNLGIIFVFGNLSFREWSRISVKRF